MERVKHLDDMFARACEERLQLRVELVPLLRTGHNRQLATQTTCNTDNVQHRQRATQTTCQTTVQLATLLRRTHAACTLQRTVPTQPD